MASPGNSAKGRKTVRDAAIIRPYCNNTTLTCADNALER